MDARTAPKSAFEPVAVQLWRVAESEAHCFDQNRDRRNVAVLRRGEGGRHVDRRGDVVMRDVVPGSDKTRGDRGVKVALLRGRHWERPRGRWRNGRRRRWGRWGAPVERRVRALYILAGDRPFRPGADDEIQIDAKIGS